GARCQPGGLRHHVKTTRNNRVGVTLLDDSTVSESRWRARETPAATAFAKQVCPPRVHPRRLMARTPASKGLLDDDDSRHPDSAYVAVVLAVVRVVAGGWEDHRVQTARGHIGRVKRAIVGGHGVRLTARVDPDDGSPRGDVKLGLVEVVVVHL